MTPLLLETIYTNGDNLLSEVEALLDNGEDPNAITKNNDSPLRSALEMRRFDVIKLLILRGADESQLGWTNIFHAIAYGSISQLEEAITACNDLGHKDSWDRTPLLFSILVGSTSKTAMLIDAGADITAAGYAPLTYAIQNDDVNMLNFLIEHGFDIEQRNDSMDGETPLITASEYSATKCLKWLINKGADIFAKNEWKEQAITFASNREIVNALVTAGANINDIDREARAKILGYQIDEKPNVSKEDFLKGLGRVFGKSNPERASNPFWLAMVKCGGSGCRARFKFDDVEISQPVWSFDRFGKSITLLPDGRIIEIAGEHEDFYDEDFCIYNDVFVHDGKGHCEIYIYPRDVFPPTDSHTATLVGEYIYVIGNLGYPEERKPGYTQVFRLNINTLKIESVETSGEMPGWISRHEAHYDGESIITIKGGELLTEENGKKDYIDNKYEYSLCLKSMKWIKLH